MERQKREHLSKNIEVRDKMLNDYDFDNFYALWESGRYNWADLIRVWRMYGGGCVFCGSDVTTKNLEFFHFDPELVKCYHCQDFDEFA